MARKSDVEIITGFLGSGKTTFINSFLDVTLDERETLIIQFENGKEGINEKLKNRSNLIIKKFNSMEELDSERFKRLIKFYKPIRIIIESNGIGNINILLQFIEQKELKPYLRRGGISTILDCVTLNMFLKNLSSIVLPNIYAADLIVLNNTSKVSDDTLEEHINKLEELNLHAHIVACSSKEELLIRLNQCSLINKGMYKRLMDYITKF